MNNLEKEIEEFYPQLCNQQHREDLKRIILLQNVASIEGRKIVDLAYKKGLI